jgi:predicted N-formylglutamate amidohydrolase
MAPPVSLLGKDEPAPFEATGRDGASPFVLVCDHAGRRLPRALGSLGLSAVELESHIAWDIGAEAVARRLAALLDAVLFWQRYSRLVIDCNRPLSAADSIVTLSERTAIPGNRGLGRADIEARKREIFQPYHDQIRGELDRREARGRAAILVTVHSFTPVFKDDPRPWHAGVLFNRDARLAELLLPLLRHEGDLHEGDLHGGDLEEGGLLIGRNEPYAASALSDYSLVEHGERRDIPCVELEIRQDLISDEAGQAAWAARLARLLPVAAAALHP